MSYIPSVLKAYIMQYMTTIWKWHKLWHYEHTTGIWWRLHC